jgi:hypothetical protein
VDFGETWKRKSRPFWLALISSIEGQIALEDQLQSKQQSAARNTVRGQIAGEGQTAVVVELGALELS